MRSRDVIKKLRAAGWYEVRVKGSHHQFRHSIWPGLVTVPHPDSDLPRARCDPSNAKGGVKIA